MKKIMMGKCIFHYIKELLCNQIKISFNLKLRQITNFLAHSQIHKPQLLKRQLNQ